MAYCEQKQKLQVRNSLINVYGRNSEVKRKEGTAEGFMS